ncbi:MAG: DotA/TraY family protein [Deltaproteobacteria bacterium]|jgi:hypothetical protein|nr:DotA/TraY family protein [Deltaproteobacteria bacterium]
MSAPPLTSQAPNNDLSGQLLDRLVGQGWDRLAPTAEVEGAVTLIRQALSGFNYLALTAISLLFVWQVIRAMTSAAQDGRPAKGLGGLWFPLRLAGALTFSAPVYQGLSIFQAGLLVAVGFSVNLANHVWGQSLEFFVEHGGRITLQAPASVVEDSHELSRGLLKGLAIQEYYRQRLNQPLAGPLAEERFWPPSGTVGGQLIVSLNPPPGSALTAGDLGRIRIPCPAPTAPICQARLAAVRTLMTELSPTAQSLADLDTALETLPADQLGRAALAYELAIEPYLAQEANSAQAEMTQELGQFAGAAKESGWLLAGAYYWALANRGRQATQSLYQSVAWGAGEAKALEGEVLSDFEAFLARYDRYQSGAFALARTLGAQPAPAEFPSLAWLREKLAGAVGRYGLERLTTHLAQGDPIPVLASLGHFLIGTAETVIGLKILTMALTQASQNSSSSFLGQVISTLSGSVSSFLTGLAGGTVTALGPYLTALSLLLLGYGFFLAYFLPALPLVFWVIGILGWLIAVVESLVAAPLWLAAHALPEGEGLSSQASNHGYRLFLGVLLRPPLMVVGFLIAMALLNLLGRLGGQAITILGAEIFQDSFLGLSGFFAMAGVLGAAVVTATYKLFGLTSQLPERVLAWIGASAPSQGEASSTREVAAKFQTLGAVGTGIVKPAAETRIKPNSQHNP